ncbi:MBL fold metallo-hydrolase [Arthrobacter sp. ISL-5]|uniref:MBL fold metallo-hydrolase n=1 Tax=Arthrobacter sp. ISL-5 TaxID=2819111 RepID=UPI001BECDE67|nr:MBL fold metallo-hydrolase [Arthrobacter sp. ISL-5]MBT2552545.1 MBL fold metallo-hydrolase [Arthrobacter sp. ISL-5]
MRTQLTLSNFTAPSRPLNLPLDVAAPEGGWTWPPTSVTLIAGEREAILVDTVPTLEDSVRLADWIEASGKVLTAIYITHGHLDHFLGTSTLLERFPNVRVVATEATVRLIEAELESGHDRAQYAPLFADEIGSIVVVPEALGGNRFELEGHELIAVPAGRSDISHSSYLYVPDLRAVIVGDIAYNDVHPTLVNSDHQTRQAWIDTLTEIQALKPEIVVAAHRREDAVNDARVLADTISYLEDANRVLGEAPGAAQFIEQMLAGHPTRLNVTTLLYSAAMLGLR